MGRTKTGAMVIPVGAEGGTERIRSVLGLGPGNSVVFEVTGEKKVLLRKATTMDLEFARALEGTLTEWLSQADEEAYRDL